MGEIIGPYGVRGWIKVRSVRRVARALLDYDEWWVKRARWRAWKQFSRLEGRMHSGSLVVALGGVETREAALAMRGAEVGRVADGAARAQKDEIYWVDLEGLEVVNRPGRCSAKLPDRGARRASAAAGRATGRGSRSPSG